MNDRDQRREDAAVRVQTFGVENDADFAAGSVAKTRFGKLDTALQNLDAAKAGQLGGGNASKVTLISALRLDCRNIRRTAVAIAQEEPGFAGDYPPAEHSDASILTTADSYLTKLEIKPADSPAVQAAKTALGQRFIDHELPPTFVADLRAARGAVGTVSQTQEGKRQTRVEDTGAVDTALADAFVQIHFLDAIMHNKYSRNADKLRAWKSATHIERAPAHNKTDDPAGGGATPTPTT